MDFAENLELVTNSGAKNSYGSAEERVNFNDNGTLLDGCQQGDILSSNSLSNPQAGRGWTPT